MRKIMIQLTHDAAVDPTVMIIVKEGDHVKTPSLPPSTPHVIKYEYTNVNSTEFISQILKKDKNLEDLLFLVYNSNNDITFRIRVKGNDIILNTIGEPEIPIPLPTHRRKLIGGAISKAKGLTLTPASSKVSTYFTSRSHTDLPSKLTDLAIVPLNISDTVTYSYKVVVNDSKKDLITNLYPYR